MKIHCPHCLEETELENSVADSAVVCHACKVAFDPRKKDTVPHAADARPELLPGICAGDGIGGYTLEKRLGKGGMGVVFQATQLSLGRKVALKVLAAELLKDPEFVRRFDREARVLASLNHPNIVQVIDKGIDRGQVFLVMEYVDGISLRDVFNEKKLPPQDALKLVPQLCDALEYAHGRGVVHRDVKPENILLARDGTVKIADFGLAKIVGDPAPGRITHSNVVMGSLDYMAPEQRERTKDADHRADIYALGVVLYEMLTGELPIGRFEPPSKKVKLEVDLDEVVLKVLAKDPELRYQRASEVGAEIRRRSSEAAAAAAGAATFVGEPDSDPLSTRHEASPHPDPLSTRHAASPHPDPLSTRRGERAGVRGATPSPSEGSSRPGADLALALDRIAAGRIGRRLGAVGAMGIASLAVLGDMVRNDDPISALAGGALLSSTLLLAIRLRLLDRIQWRAGWGTHVDPEKPKKRRTFPRPIGELVVVAILAFIFVNRPYDIAIAAALLPFALAVWSESPRLFKKEGDMPLPKELQHLAQPIPAGSAGVIPIPMAPPRPRLSILAVLGFIAAAFFFALSTAGYSLIDWARSADFAFLDGFTESASGRYDLLGLAHSSPSLVGAAFHFGSTAAGIGAVLLFGLCGATFFSIGRKVAIRGRGFALFGMILAALVGFEVLKVSRFADEKLRICDDARRNPLEVGNDNFMNWHRVERMMHVAALEDAGAAGIPAIAKHAQEDRSLAVRYAAAFALASKLETADTKDGAITQALRAVAEKETAEPIRDLARWSLAEPAARAGMAEPNPRPDLYHGGSGASVSIRTSHSARRVRHGKRVPQGTDEVKVELPGGVRIEADDEGARFEGPGVIIDADEGGAKVEAGGGKIEAR